jgi:hypothetical protein
LATTKPATTPDPTPAWIDELGSLEKELAPLKTKIQRVEMLRKQIRTAAETGSATAEIQVSGSRYIAILGPRGNQTIINLPELVKRIKAAAFAKFATTTLSALQQHVDAETVEAVTATEATGPRSLKILEKGTAA